MPRVLLVFIDGIGIGRPVAGNPFEGAPIGILAACAGRGAGPLSRDIAVGEVDATLGYGGLPQSATGQAVLFTGEDAIGVAGGHASGFPSRAVAGLITERSILRRAGEQGLRSGFLNAFDRDRAERITRVARGEERPLRHRKPSASALAALAGGGRLRTFDDALEGRASTFDMTGEACRAYGLPAPEVSIEQSARAVARGASELDLAMFELFLTDMAGHAQDVTWARREIDRTERFLGALFSAVTPGEQLVVVTSDHGNLEDLSTSSHTRARVPLIAFGANAESFVSGPRTIREVGEKLLASCLPS